MDKYQLFEKVGEGTYGTVWRAVNKQTNELVAIKIFRKVDEEGFNFFTLNHGKIISYHMNLSRSAVQELKFLQTLKGSSGVVPLLDSYVHDGKLALVFPFAESDLTGLCESGPHLKLAEVKCIMKQILEAMVRIHSFNLIHRDLKSANILFHRGHVYVADVGMMTQHAKDGLHDPNLITLWYRAPELLLGKSNYGTEVDMWSIGCILVEIMTKRTPFPGISEAHQMDRIFSITGAPTQQTWGDEVLNYPGFKKIRKDAYKTNKIAQTFKDWEPECLDFLMKLWEAPNKRLTAAEALKHNWFLAEPLACEPHNLPRVSLHEYEVKKRRQTQQAQDPKRTRLDAHQMQRGPQGNGQPQQSNPHGQPVRPTAMKPFNSTQNQRPMYVSKRSNPPNQQMPMHVQPVTN